MNSFGLGLVLNFVDNASSGMGNATRAFQQMSVTADTVASSVSNSITDIVTASYALDSVGSTIQNTGMSILSVFGGVSQSVIDAGMSMQGYRMQLSALYGSVEAGEQKIQEIKDYAMSSVFDIQSLIPAVTTMKAVGIEAMEEITTSSGEHTQKLLDYASDIAAMVPNMRNTYGTGVQAAMGALKEYIAEGNSLSLKRGAGLDITGILGEDKGSTMKERAQQVADLVEQLNILGYTEKLSGTPTQRLSNMQDALFNSLTKIADSGVFEAYCDLLEQLSNWVFSLVDNEETFNVITGVLADTITTILSPLRSLLDFIIENSNAIINWIKEHPVLTKNILLTVAAIGGLLIVGGTLLKLISTMGMAMAGLAFLKQLPTLLGALGSAFRGVALKVAPFIALAGLAYIAWKENLFGIRDTATKVISDLGSIFSLVGDAWGDNTLSEENFQKANDLGILPLIGGLLQLKYYWDFLTEGFKTGFKAFFEGLAESLNQLGILDIDITEIVASFGDFLKSLTEVGQEDRWTKIGEAIGKIVGFLVVFIVTINSLKGLFTIIKSIATLFSGVGKVLSFVWGITKFLFNPIIMIAPKILAFLKNFGAAIALMKEGFGFFSVMGAWFPKLAGIITAIGGAFAKVGGIFKIIGSAIMGVLSSIATALGIPVAGVIALIAVIVSLGITIYESFGTIVNYVKTTLTDIFGGIKTIFTGIIDFFTGVFTGDWDLAWQGIVGIFKGVFETLTGIAKGVVNGIILVVNTLISTLYRILAAVVNGIGSIFGSIASALGFEDMGFSIPKTPPQIPYLADGGVAVKATPAVVGDGDESEAILPLNTKVFSEIAKGINNQRPVQAQQPVQNDYSVTFSAGSIVIQLANATEAELERAAEKLMKIIERKQQLKAMAVRA